MKNLLSLTIIIFWLTSFPLQGFLLPQKEWFFWFLFFHFIGYIVIFLHFEWFKKFNFFPFFIIINALLTALFPFLSDVLKLYNLILLGLLSPLTILKTLFLLKEKGSSYLPYTGLILGNVVTLTCQFLPLPNVYFYFFLGICLISLYFFKNPVIHFSEKDFSFFNLKDLIYLFLFIFVFYFSGSLIYLWIEKNFYQQLLSWAALVLFYSLGILLSIFIKKKNLLPYKEIFILGIVFLAISKAFFHLESQKIIFLAQLFVFLASGFMDFITLYFFINFFPTPKLIPLLYALISLALFLGHIIFKYSILYQREYIPSFLTFLALLSFIFLYKTKIEEKKELLKEEKSEEKLSLNLTPEILKDKINSVLSYNLEKPITSRESEVLFYHIIEGKNLQEVAKILRISRSSVREYLKRASIKLGCSVYELSNKIKEILS